ncbi:putative lipoprotein YbbD precursor [Pseudobythopirellula maris]|uniref:beta-N-acetylhexosaminidase n=1 Tax=Pseudobythopirellula maris TaxID=2527991 RepID=A0A5C5ZJP0_9BACT|nr:glycoside hydrolase family 3 N-terminal domain-containing protein [Pseudobythopirellula maris]TWT87257.1 putative lipoprotein YbbD precursor [Pseudobythopirellula maris]
MTLAWPPTELEDKLAQLIFVRIGSNLSPIRRASEDEGRIAALIERLPIGGLLLFNGVWPDVRDTLKRLQAKSRWPLLVGSDIERGAGQQVHGLTLFPHAGAFGALGDRAEERLAEVAVTTAREALATGIQIAFAPVADVDTNPRNPIIATRALGQTPERVSRLAAAFVRAAENAGLMTTPKHFPGHGDTHQDSHDAAPSLDRDLESLQQTELPPFRETIDAGASLVMTAHVSYGALDPSGAPATLSAAITENLLRGELGFRGVACSDSLLMAGVRDRFENEGALAEATLMAGVDVLLDVEDPVAVVEYLAQRVRSGDLPLARIDEAIERVGVLKARTAKLLASGPKLIACDGIESAAKLSKDVAAEAVRVEGDAAAALRRDEPLMAVLFKPFDLLSDPSEQPLADALRERFSDVRYFEFGPEPDERTLAALRAALDEGRRLLVALIVKPAAWHAFGLNDAQRPIVDELVAGHEPILASLGVPTVLEDYPSAPMRICTFSDVPVSQEALADAILTPSPQAAPTSPCSPSRYL